MGRMLWKPSLERIQAGNMYRFMLYVNRKYGREFLAYEDLYAWSISNIRDFWASMWEFGEVIHSAPFSEVVDDPMKMPGARWFAGARLNFAENLLRYRDNRIALSFKGEGGETGNITYRELWKRVGRLAGSLRQIGIVPGDRIAAYMPNMIETVIAMLAATSLGAIWSSVSPDFGMRGVTDRFGQIRPRVLFTADGYRYNGRKIDSLKNVSEVVKRIASIETVVVVPYVDSAPGADGVPNGVLFDEFLSDEDDPGIEFEQLPADHPVYIMYSSGTTGVPKCIVHGAAGTLIQHIKELKLHTDIGRDDTFFYYTTCGWMMWNWMVSSLALGARVLLYDGSPMYPGPEVLWELARSEGVTIFGTSAKYLAAVEKSGLKPAESHHPSDLRTILSTGSPLSVESFEFVYRDVKNDVLLSSISGGTDIVSCFALGNPMGPVYAGELQCRGLGMKVEAYNERGKSVIDEKGELVCTAAAPSMPIYFRDDPDGQKYRRAYFDLFPGVWSHGDYVEIKKDGGVIIYGRSDATLNPGGVRIGTAEIYRPIATIPEILDSVVVGQDWDNDVRIVLFVKLRDGLELNDELRDRIGKTIRDGATPRHVPARIVAVPDIPYTLSGKKVEIAVRRVIHGQEVTNRDALANPESLEYFRNLPELAG